MKRYGALILGMVLALPLFSQNIAEEELKKKLQDVTFVNYVGPHAYVNTRAEIKALGESLGTAIKTAPQANWNQLYTVKRVWEKSSGKLSADVLILAPGAGVDHIRNLNLIIAGYLEKSFGYKESDAALLADFITKYNAVYRGDMAFVGANYIPGVADLVTKDKLGLSKVFSEWPGKTQILIPLRDTLSSGDKGKVNADEVSNKDVMNTLKDDPKTLEDRKDVTNLKEKEITDEQKAIQAKEEELKKKQEELDRQKAEQAKLAQNTTKPADNKTTDTTKPADNKTTDTTKPADNKTTDTTKPTDSQSDGAKKLAEEQKKLDQEKAALEAAKAENTKRDAALQNDRKTIAEEEKKLQNTNKTDPGKVTAPPQKPQINPVIFLRVNGTTELSQLVILDSKGKTLVSSSEINSVRGKRFEIFQNQILVIAGRTEGDGAVRLMLLKKEDLSSLSQGTDDIHPKSLLVLSGSQFYAVTKNKAGLWVLGLFDQTLKLQSTSELEVQPDSAVAISDGLLFIHDKNGKVLILDPKTLKKSGVVNG